MREGPNLNIARCGHSCNKMVINEKVFIIVAGGFFEDSVELLDPMSDQGWIFGKYVMFQILDRKLLIFGILVCYRNSGSLWFLVKKKLFCEIYRSFVKILMNRNFSVVQNIVSCIFGKANKYSWYSSAVN